MSTLRGFSRSDGRFGIRNHVLVLPARRAANRAAELAVDGIAGAVTITHDIAGPTESEFDRIATTLVGFANNPNVAAVVVIGLNDDDRWLADAISERGTPVEFLTLSAARGVLAGAELARPIVQSLVDRASAMKRVPMPIDALILGLECGGSDGFSGITANPALGLASDRLTAEGGSAILAEIPELVGAEDLLAARAISPEVADAIRKVIADLEDSVRNLGIDVRGAQPTPGNQEGGLSTIEEKALGSAKKGGSAPIVGVVGFAERPMHRGLSIMDTPGHDIEQMVGMVAGGAQIVAFTTGRGTPTGSPIAPCLKISTNTEIFRRLSDDIDLDAGTILDGTESLASVGERIFAKLIATVNGELTASERRGHAEFAVSRLYLSGDVPSGDIAVEAR